MPIEFHPEVTWTGFKDKLDKTENPRHRAMLENIMIHARAEVEGDVEGIIATLNPDPQYHFWSDFMDSGPKGMAAVREYYNHIMKTQSGTLESVKKRIVVDDENIAFETVTRWLVAASVAKELGYSDSDIDDDDAVYVAKIRSMCMFSFDEEARCVGEDGIGAKIGIEKVAPEDLPQSYHDAIAAAAALQG
ncbi:hypothetical protein [Rhodococcus globerulus]|uniref:hypothetical protein n=1 Tax=Rhodococcus globerulus TaxID=33008 RepID=UPI0030187A04